MASGGYSHDSFAAPQTGYGLKDGRLTHISEVSRGLDCQCACVICHQALIAKKGRKRLHHFAHKVESNCEGASESALHMLSKELISEMTWMEIPPYHFSMTRRKKSGLLVSHNQQVANGGRVMISSVKLESYEKGFIADVLLDCFDKHLIVEIAVTHKVDRQKLRHIRRRDIPAIEIRLDTRDALLPRDELRALLQNGHEIKHWLFHPRQRPAEKVFIRKFRNHLNRKVAHQIDNRGRREEKTRSAAIQSNEANRIGYASYTVSRIDEMKLRERLGEEFRRKHNRYPLMDECLRLWPKLWGKSAKGRDIQ